MRRVALAPTEPVLPTRLGRDLLMALTVVAMTVLALAPSAVGQDDALVLLERGEGAHIVDDARIINGVDEEALQADLEALADETGIDIVVYTRQRERVGDRRDARDDAASVLDEWQVGGEAGRGAVMFWNINPEGSVARNGVALGDGFVGIDARDVDEAVNSAVLPGLQSQDWVSALLTGQLELQARLSAAAPAETPAPLRTPRPGTSVPPRRPAVAEGGDPRVACRRTRGRPSRTPSTGFGSTTTRRSSVPRSSTGSAMSSQPSRNAPAPRS